jgi:hypothetical protein
MKISKDVKWSCHPRHRVDLVLKLEALHLEWLGIRMLCLDFDVTRLEKIENLDVFDKVTSLYLQNVSILSLATANALEFNYED